jgi:hypothetical protein
MDILKIPNNIFNSKNIKNFSNSSPTWLEYVIDITDKNSFFVVSYCIYQNNGTITKVDSSLNILEYYIFTKNNDDIQNNILKYDGFSYIFSSFNSEDKETDKYYSKEISENDSIYDKTIYKQSIIDNYEKSFYYSIKKDKIFDFFQEKEISDKLINIMNLLEVESLMFAEKNNRKIVYVTDEKTRKIEFEKIYF